MISIETQIVHTETEREKFNILNVIVQGGKKIDDSTMAQLNDDGNVRKQFPYIKKYITIDRGEKAIKWRPKITNGHLRTPNTADFDLVRLQLRVVRRSPKPWHKAGW